MTTGTRVLLASRPVGEPKASDFRFEQMPVPAPKPGEMLLKTLWLSLDPYMRGRMNAGRSYAAPVEIGEVMDGGAAQRADARADQGVLAAFLAVVGVRQIAEQGAAQGAGDRARAGVVALRRGAVGICGGAGGGAHQGGDADADYGRARDERGAHGCGSLLVQWREKRRPYREGSDLYRR